MKYKIVGIEHAVGDFIPTSGRNANIQQHYDLYRLHSLKACKTCIGGLECVVVRCTPDLMGQIIADCGGKIDNVVSRTFDFETRNSFGKVNLVDYEVLN